MLKSINFNRCISLCIIAIMGIVNATYAKSSDGAILINSDNVEGEIYNMWNTRAYPGATMWLNDSYAEHIKNVGTYQNRATNVRFIGGAYKIDKSGQAIRDYTMEAFKGVNPDGSLECDFTNMHKIIRNQLSVGYTPNIVLDNVPWAMVENSPMKVYGQVAPPDNYDLWFRYVAMIVRELVDTYGESQLRSWMFRVGTEPNFHGHWDGKEKPQDTWSTPERKAAYFKHYDWTVAAVESVLSEPYIGPGNFVLHSGQVGEGDGFGDNDWIFDILDHCSKGINDWKESQGMNDVRGTRICFFSQSAYKLDKNEYIIKPYTLEAALQEFNRRKVVAGYPDMTYEIHEYGDMYGVLGDRPNRMMIEWGIGFFAYTMDMGYKYGMSNVFQWGDCATSPNRFVVDALSDMVGGDRIEVDNQSDRAAYDDSKKFKTGAISAWKGDSLHIMSYAFIDDYLNPESETETEIRLEIRGEKFQNIKKWRLTEYYVNRDNIALWEQIKDIKKAGLTPLKTLSPKRSEWTFDTPTTRWGANANPILKANAEKYIEMIKPQKISTDKVIKSKDGVIIIDRKMVGTSARSFILTPML